MQELALLTIVAESCSHIYNLFLSKLNPGVLQKPYKCYVYQTCCN